MGPLVAVVTKGCTETIGTIGSWGLESESIIEIC